MISNTSSVPALSGAFIDLDMVKRETKPRERRTKIICTIGPACWEVEQLELLMETGMDVARFNFSHGDHEGHGKVLDRLRQAAKNKKREIGMLSVMLCWMWSVILCCFDLQYIYGLIWLFVLFSL